MPQNKSRCGVIEVSKKKKTKVPSTSILQLNLTAPASPEKASHSMSVGWQKLSLRWVADTRGVIRAKPGGPFPVMEGRGSVTLLHQEDGLLEARRWRGFRRAPGGSEVEGL